MNNVRRIGLLYAVLVILAIALGMPLELANNFADIRKDVTKTLRVIFTQF